MRPNLNSEAKRAIFLRKNAKNAIFATLSFDQLSFYVKHLWTKLTIPAYSPENSAEANASGFFRQLMVFAQ